MYVYIDSMYLSSGMHLTFFFVSPVIGKHSLMPKNVLERLMIYINTLVAMEGLVETAIFHKHAKLLTHTTPWRAHDARNNSRKYIR